MAAKAKDEAGRWKKMAQEAKEAAAKQMAEDEAEVKAKKA